MVGALFFYYYTIKKMINEIDWYCEKAQNDYCDINNVIESFSEVIDSLNNLLRKFE